MSTASRLDKIEGALSPKAVLLRWFGDFYARHDSFDGYIRSAAKDPKHRTASVLLLEDICQWQKQRARVKPRMSASERAAEIVDAYLPGVLFESINQDLYQKLMTANLSEKILLAGLERLCIAALRPLRDMPCEVDRKTADALRVVIVSEVLTVGEAAAQISTHLASNRTDAGSGDAPEPPSASDLSAKVSHVLSANRPIEGRLVEFARFPLHRNKFPLIGRCLIVRHLVELAEFAALLEPHGLHLMQPVDDHPLATLRIWSDQNQQPATADEIAEVRAAARANFERFPGRLEEGEGYQVLHVDDYLKWSERKNQGVRVLPGVAVRA